MSIAARMNRSPQKLVAKSGWGASKLPKGKIWRAFQFRSSRHSAEVVELRVDAKQENQTQQNLGRRATVGSPIIKHLNADKSGCGAIIEGLSSVMSYEITIDSVARAKHFHAYPPAA